MTDILWAEVDPKDLTERYVAVWNETDPDRRRAAVAQLWAEDGVHVLQPPEEINTAAAGLGFSTTTLRARGHAELEFRVRRAHEEFVAAGIYSFRLRGGADRLDDVVKFTWEMVARDSRDVVAVGMEILVLSPDGRVATDYQFIER